MTNHDSTLTVLIQDLDTLRRKQLLLIVLVVVSFVGISGSLYLNFKYSAELADIKLAMKSNDLDVKTIHAQTFDCDSIKVKDLNVVGIEGSSEKVFIRSNVISMRTNDRPLIELRTDDGIHVDLLDERHRLRMVLGQAALNRAKSGQTIITPVSTITGFNTEGKVINGLEILYEDPVGR